MVAAYTPRFTPISYDGIDKNTPAGELPELLDRLEQRGGYDPRTGQLTPFKNISDDFDESLINQMLDSMTADAWTYTMIERLRQSPYVSLSLVIRSGLLPGMTNPIHIFVLPTTLLTQLTSNSCVIKSVATSLSS